MRRHQTCSHIAGCQHHHAVGCHALRRPDAVSAQRQQMQFQQQCEPLGETPHCTRRNLISKIAVVEAAMVALPLVGQLVAVGPSAAAGKLEATQVTESR